jgi:hypothetical protein
VIVDLENQIGGGVQEFGDIVRILRGQSARSPASQAKSGRKPGVPKQGYPTPLSRRRAV